jgi:hypothetical protein
MPALTVNEVHIAGTLDLTGLVATEVIANGASIGADLNLTRATLTNESRPARDRGPRLRSRGEHGGSADLPPSPDTRSKRFAHSGSGNRSLQPVQTTQSPAPERSVRLALAQLVYRIWAQRCPASLPVASTFAQIADTHLSTGAERRQVGWDTSDLAGQIGPHKVP